MALVAFGTTLVAGADVSDVHQLKTDTFEEFVKTNEIVLAEFFAPWWYVTFGFIVRFLLTLLCRLLTNL
jgi:hypothetical protein